MHLNDTHVLFIYFATCTCTPSSIIYSIQLATPTLSLVSSTTILPCHAIPLLLVRPFIHSFICAVIHLFAIQRASNRPSSSVIYQQLVQFIYLFWMSLLYPQGYFIIYLCNCYVMALDTCNRMHFYILLYLYLHN